MRIMRKTVLACAVVAFACVPAAFAGQPANVPLPAGARFCPAPGADNSEFMGSYFSIDAQTGQMTRHDPGSAPIGVTPEPTAREEVLFVAPPISVENVYVPPPGGPALPPRTMATGVMSQPGQMRQQYRLPPQPRPQQQQYRAQPQMQHYAQPQQHIQQPYPYQAQAQTRQAPPQRQVRSQQHLAPYPQQQYRR